MDTLLLNGVTDTGNLVTVRSLESNDSKALSHVLLKVFELTVFLGVRQLQPEWSLLHEEKLGAQEKDAGISGKRKCFVHAKFSPGQRLDILFHLGYFSLQ